MTVPKIQSQFSAAVAPTTLASAKPKRSSPFPIRISEEERAYLEKKAGSLSLGTYIRKELLKGFDGKTTRARRKLHKPSIDQKIASELLAELGRSRIPSNLNQLAKSANFGTLDIADETDRQLQEAAQAVIAMREALFVALGLRIGGDRP